MQTVKDLAKQHLRKGHHQGFYKVHTCADYFPSIMYAKDTKMIFSVTLPLHVTFTNNHTQSKLV